MDIPFKARGIPDHLLTLENEQRDIRVRQHMAAQALLRRDFESFRAAFCLPIPDFLISGKPQDFPGERL